MPSHVKKPKPRPKRKRWNGREAPLPKPRCKPRPKNMDQPLPQAAQPECCNRCGADTQFTARGWRCPYGCPGSTRKGREPGNVTRELSSMGLEIIVHHPEEFSVYRPDEVPMVAWTGDPT